MERRGALELLRRRDFRRLYLAVAVSELGDAFQYIAIMWFALVKGGPIGVVAVRLADSVPALLFGFHGGIVADKWDRKRTMISADLARGVILVPIAIAGLSNILPLWGLVVAAFLVETATSYFAPAYSAILPALVDRENVQEANGLLGATTNALSIGGWAAAAGLLAIAPISTFFALNAASFFVSALFISRIARREAMTIASSEPPRIREAFDAMRPIPALAIGTVVVGLAVTVSSGTWIAGVPDLIREVLPSRRRRICDRDGRLRDGLGRGGHNPRALSDRQQGAREHVGVDTLSARVRDVCARHFAPDGDRGRFSLRSRSGQRGDSASLRGAGTSRG